MAIWDAESWIGIDCGGMLPETGDPWSGLRGRLACLRLDDLQVFYSEEPQYDNLIKVVQHRILGLIVVQYIILVFQQADHVVMVIYRSLANIMQHTLSLLDPFDQADALLRVQLGKQLERFVVAAAHVCPNFVRGVVDVDAALLVVPAVLCRQAHTVKQHTIEQLRVRR